MSQLDSLKASIKNYKIHSLFVRNFFIILLVVMIPLDIISLFFYTSSSNAMRQEIYQTNYNFTYTVRSITDTLMKEMQTLAINTAIQNEVISYFMSEPMAGDISATQSSLAKYCKNFTYTHRYLHSMYIYCEGTDTVLADYETYDRASFSDTGWLESYYALRQDETKIMLRARNDYYPYFLTLIQPVFTTDVDRMGAVIINVNVQELTKAFRYLDSPSAQKIYIADNNNRIIYSENQNEILSDTGSSAMTSAIFAAKAKSDISFKQEGITYLFSDIESQFFDWHYYCAVPMDIYAGRTKTISMYLLILMALSLIIGAVGSFYISTRTFRPIGSILELIASPDGRSESLYSDAPKNESSYILSRIANTLSANKQLKEELDTKLMLLKHAQIVALQSQINPHFLFNTLDTINWMAIDAFEGENELSDALTSLGNLFKLNIDTANYLTDLENELIYTRQYIEILKLRHKDVFSVVWSVDDSLKNCKVPRLVLQPLIENALYHGIMPKRTAGTIQVKVSKEGGDLQLLIADDGVGLAPAKLEQLTTELEKDYLFGSKHIGLKNINQRVKLIYGNAYGIKLRSSKDGTRVTLRMPRVE